MSVSPKRKAALQWFHDRGEASSYHYSGGHHLKASCGETIRGGYPLGTLLEDKDIRRLRSENVGLSGVWGIYALTDLGRRRLNGDDV